MRNKQNLKKHFEAILGREFSIDFPGDGGVALREWVGTYTDLEGTLTSRDIDTTGESTKACDKKQILDVSGSARTGSDGKIDFSLSDFFCGGFEFKHPVNFLATPRSTSPVFLTTLRTLTSDWKDVKITVNAWDSSGAPAVNISFDWRCRVPYVPSLIG
jgi:hypothetical protein